MKRLPFIILLLPVAAFFILGISRESKIGADIKPVQDVPTLFEAKVALIDRGAKLEHAKASVLEGAGEVKTEMVKAAPEVRVKKWNNEVDLGVKYSAIASAGTMKGNVMEWKGTKEDIRAYVLDPAEGMEDGGLEIELVLKEKPATNVFQFEIEGYEELVFEYQPPLNELAECFAGSTETVCLDEEGNEIGFMPENVVGSYAVYHQSKVNHKLGTTNYATGKVGHIYRPKIIDANGVETWGTLSYENGLLWVTAPQGFLDTATYPVIVDPTLGYTSLGSFRIEFLAVGDGFSVFSNKRANGGFTLGVEASVDSVSLGLWPNTTSPMSVDFSALIYTEDSGGTGIHDRVYFAETQNMAFATDTANFYQFTTTSGNILADDYIIAATGNSTDVPYDVAGIYIARDAVGGQRSYVKTSSYGTLTNENPWSSTVASTTLKFSLYITYTEASADTSEIQEVNGVPQANIGTINGVEAANIGTVNGKTF